MEPSCLQRKEAKVTYMWVDPQQSTKIINIPPFSTWKSYKGVFNRSASLANFLAIIAKGAPTFSAVVVFWSP